MSRWFRFYAEALNDPKVQRLDGDTFKFWVNVLCIASQNEGRLPDVQDIAFSMRIDDNGCRTVLERLLNAGLIDKCNGGPNGWHYAPHGWHKRQYKSDGSTERVKRFRERSKPVTETLSDTETDTETEVIEPKGSCASDEAPGLKPEHVVEVWNEHAPRLGKPCVRNLTPERRQLLKARIGQYTLEDFQQVFGKIERSAFLRGDTGWRGCTFDWVFKKANFQKIIEGNYDH